MVSENQEPEAYLSENSDLLGNLSIGSYGVIVSGSLPHSFPLETDRQSDVFLGAICHSFFTLGVSFKGNMLNYIQSHCESRLSICIN